MISVAVPLCSLLYPSLFLSPLTHRPLVLSDVSYNVTIKPTQVSQEIVNTDEEIDLVFGKGSLDSGWFCHLIHLYAISRELCEAAYFSQA